MMRFKRHARRPWRLPGKNRQSTTRGPITKHIYYHHPFFNITQVTTTTVSSPLTTVALLTMATILTGVSGPSSTVTQSFATTTGPPLVATTSADDLSTGMALSSPPSVESTTATVGEPPTDLPEVWNVFSNSNVSLFFDDSSVVPIVLLAPVLGVIILATVIGNVFVIAAILLERHLQNVANYLILSLAVADLLVACLVMPLSAVYEVSDQWTLGPELCDMWTSSDVLCCTASILHLVAIALDRYWAVTNIDYIHQRTAKRIGFMILVIWTVAFLVCIAPVLGWKDPGWEARISENRTCLVSQDIGYQVFATASSFYLPLFVILVLYWRIFQTARKRIRRRLQATSQGAMQQTGRHPPAGGVIAGLCAAGATGGHGGIAAAVVGVIGRPLPTISEATTTTTTTAFTNVSSTNTSPEKGSYSNGVEADLPTCDPSSMAAYQPVHHHHPPKRKNKEAADSKRERKAAKTLAIITGAFVICWLPFFIMAILLPICNLYQICVLNEYLFAFFLWLGYFNSTLNPIIYTIFSPEFRHAFKRLLCGRRNSTRARRQRHLGVRHFH